MSPAEIEITIRGDEALSFQCSRYGFKLHIPKGALPNNLTIHVRVILSGQYEFPVNSELISAIYQISCPVRPTKPVILEIQHCAIIESSEQSSFLTFVRAEDSQNVKFHPIEGGQFSSYTSYAAISLENFSYFATILYYVSLGYYRLPPVDYYTEVYVTPLRKKWEVYCILIKKLVAVMTVSVSYVDRVMCYCLELFSC